MTYAIRTVVVRSFLSLLLVHSSHCLAATSNSDWAFWYEDHDSTPVQVGRGSSLNLTWVGNITKVQESATLTGYQIGYSSGHADRLIVDTMGYSVARGYTFTRRCYEDLEEGAYLCALTLTIEKVGSRDSGIFLLQPFTEAGAYEVTVAKEVIVKMLAQPRLYFNDIDLDQVTPSEPIEMQTGSHRVTCHVDAPSVADTNVTLENNGAKVMPQGQPKEEPTEDANLSRITVTANVTIATGSNLLRCVVEDSESRLAAFLTILARGENTSLAPGENTTLAPDENGTLAPGGNGENTSLAPGENTSLAPGENTSLAPGENTSLAPGENTSLAPGENTSLEPGENGENTSLAPGGNTTLIPDGNRSLAPGENGTLGPGENTSLAPGENTSLAPGENTSLAPGENTSLAPGENTSLAPGENATLAPGENATLAPGENATLSPGENATLAPGENATLSPGENGSHRPTHASVKWLLLAGVLAMFGWR